MSALPITLPTAPAESAPISRHLRVVTEADAARAAADDEAGRRALVAALRWASRSAPRPVASGRSGAVQPPLVLTARGRAAVRVLVGLAASVLAILAGVAIGLVLRAAPVAGESVVVGSGDTLWSIAAAVPGTDVRDAVAQIVELNGLAGAQIHPGQVLVLPAP
ncbi:MAG: LysM peptidoglycan-binding domain-containing protein [bacterium]|nr:LysM peptidoglycan-binding domain-containing protein [bacterium]